MKRQGKFILSAVALIALAGTQASVSAQYVISARAGVINYTTGPVSYRPSSDPNWSSLSGAEAMSLPRLSEGDHLKTEAWGKAEVLLSPGSYLRLGRSAEIMMLSTDLAATAFELLTGSAILEVGNLQKGFSISVRTPHTVVKIKKDGLYRIDVAPDGTRLIVRKGEAWILQTDGTLKKIKKNNTVLVSTQSAEIAKLSRAQQDEFDLWSADRAELLLAANQAVLRRSRYWSGVNFWGSTWVYDPFFGCYTFLPWGYPFWSVYGFGYYGCPFWENWSGFWSGAHPGGYSGGTPPSHRPPRTEKVKPNFSIYKRVRHLRGDLGYGRAITPTVGSSRRFPPTAGMPRGSMRRVPSTGYWRGTGGRSHGGLRTGRSVGIHSGSIRGLPNGHRSGRPR